MQTDFVVLATARSGSGWLINTLSNIESVTCYGELFHVKPKVVEADKIRFPRFTLWRQKKAGIRPFTTYRYLDEVFKENQTTGFKLMYIHALRNPEINSYLLSRHIAVIHLIRKNTFNSVLSSLVARQRGKWHFKEGESIPEEKPIELDPQFVIRRMRSKIRMITLAKTTLKASRLKQIEIYYEDLLADKQNFEPIWKFLSVNFDKSPPVWQLRKSTKKEPSESIANFDEIRDGLVNAGFGNFLADYQG
jgi:LPS sulfotransferase NodH